MKTLCVMIFYIQACEDILGCKLCNQVKERLRERKKEGGQWVWGILELTASEQKYFKYELLI